MEKIVGIGEYAVSNLESDVIKTFALASCVAVTIFSPSKMAAGMIHLALPSPIIKYDGISRPYYFVTTGLPLLFNKMYTLYGCNKDDLIINIYGGANSISGQDHFEIGKRNVEAVKRILERLNIKIDYIEVGGSFSRTLEMKVATGNVIVKHQPIKI
jgi:chemotaxis protein CheD